MPNSTTNHSTKRQGVAHAVVKKGRKGLVLPSLLRKTKTTHASRLVPFQKRTVVHPPPSEAEGVPTKITTLKDRRHPQEDRISDLTNPNFEARETPPFQEIQPLLVDATQQDLSSLSNNSHSINPGDQHPQQQHRDRAKFLAAKAAAEKALRMKAAVPNKKPSEKAASSIRSRGGGATVDSQHQQHSMALGRNLQLTSPSPITLDRVNIQQQQAGSVARSVASSSTRRHGKTGVASKKDAAAAAATHMSQIIPHVLSPMSDAAIADPSNNHNRKVLERQLSPRTDDAAVPSDERRSNGTDDAAEALQTALDAPTANRPSSPLKLPFQKVKALLQRVQHPPHHHHKHDDGEPLEEDDGDGEECVAVSGIHVSRSNIDENQATVVPASFSMHMDAATEGSTAEEEIGGSGSSGSSSYLLNTNNNHPRKLSSPRQEPPTPTSSSSEMEDVDIVADRSDSPELQATFTERSDSPEPAERAAEPRDGRHYRRRLRGLEPEAEVVGEDHRVPVDAPEFETLVMVEEDSKLLMEESGGHLSVVGANVSASSNSPDEDDDNEEEDDGGATTSMEDEQSHLSVMGIPVVSGNDAASADIERGGRGVAQGATKPHTSLPLRILLSKKKSHEAASVKGTDSREVADEGEEAEEENSDKENSEEHVARSVEEGALMKAYMEELALKASASNLAGPDKQKHINPFDSSSVSSPSAKEATATKPINPFDSSSSDDDQEDDDDDVSEAEDAFAAIVAVEKKKHDGVKNGTNNVSAAISSFEKKKNPIVAKSWSAKDHPVLAKTWTERAKSLPPTKPVIKSPFHDSESEEGGFPTAAIRAPRPKSTVSEKTKPVPARKAPIKSPFYDSDSDDEEGIPSPTPTKPPAKAQVAPLPEPRKTIAHKNTTRPDPSPLSERKEAQLNLNKKEPSKGAEPPAKDIPKVEKEAPDPDQSFRFPLNEVDADGSMDVSYLDQTHDNQDTISTHDSFGPQLEMDRYAVTPSQQLLKQNIRSVSFVTREDGRDSPALADSLTETTLTRHERKESASTGGIVSGFLMNACGFRSPKKPVEQSPVVLAKVIPPAPPHVKDETPRISNNAKQAPSSSGMVSERRRFFGGASLSQAPDPDAMVHTTKSESEASREDPIGMTPRRSFEDASAFRRSADGASDIAFHQTAGDGDDEASSGKAMRRGTDESSGKEFRHNADESSGKEARHSTDELSGKASRRRVEELSGRASHPSRVRLNTSESDSVDLDDGDRYRILEDNSPGLPPHDHSSLSTSASEAADPLKKASFVDRIVAFGQAAVCLSPSSKKTLDYRVAQLSPNSKTLLRKSIQSAEMDVNVTAPPSHGSYTFEDEKKDDTTVDIAAQKPTKKMVLELEVKEKAKELSAKSVHRMLPLLKDTTTATSKKSEKVTQQPKLKNVFTTLRSSSPVTSEIVDTAKTKELKAQLQEFSTTVKMAAKNSIKQAKSEGTPKPVWTQELIDLTGVTSYNDLDDEEAVWLFDLSPKSSAKRVVRSPRSDFESLMEFAAKKLGVSSDDEDLAKGGSEASQRQTLAVLSRSMATSDKNEATRPSSTVPKPEVPAPPQTRAQVTVEDEGKTHRHDAVGEIILGYEIIPATASQPSNDDVGGESRVKVPRGSEESVVSGETSEASAMNEMDEISSSDGMQTLLAKVKRDLDAMPTEPGKDQGASSKQSLSSSSSRKHRKPKKNTSPTSSVVSATRRDFLEVLFDRTEALFCGGRNTYDGILKKVDSPKKRKSRKKSSKSIKVQSAPKEEAREEEKPPAVKRLETIEQEDDDAEKDSVLSCSSCIDNVEDMLGMSIGQNRHQPDNPNVCTVGEQATNTVEQGSSTYPLIAERDDTRERERIDMLVAKALATHDNKEHHNETYHDVEKQAPRPEDFIAIDPSSKAANNDRSGIATKTESDELSTESSRELLELEETYHDVVLEAKAPRPEILMAIDQTSKADNNHRAGIAPEPTRVTPMPEEYLSGEPTAAKRTDSDAPTSSTHYRNNRLPPTPEIFDPAPESADQESSNASMRPLDGRSGTPFLLPSNTSPSAKLANDAADPQSEMSVILPSLTDPSEQAFVGEDGASVLPTSSLEPCTKAALNGDGGLTSETTALSNQDPTGEAASFPTSVDPTRKEGNSGGDASQPRMAMNQYSNREDSLSSGTAMEGAQPETPIVIKSISVIDEQNKASFNVPAENPKQLYVEGEGDYRSQPKTPIVKGVAEFGAHPQTPIVIKNATIHSPLAVEDYKLPRTNIMFSSNASWRSSGGIEVGTRPETPIVLNTTSGSTRSSSRGLIPIAPSRTSTQSDGTGPETPIVIKDTERHPTFFGIEHSQIPRDPLADHPRDPPMLQNESSGSAEIVAKQNQYEHPPVTATARVDGSGADNVRSESTHIPHLPRDPSICHLQPSLSGEDASDECQYTDGTPSQSAESNKDSSQSETFLEEDLNVAQEQSQQQQQPQQHDLDSGGNTGTTVPATSEAKTSAIVADNELVIQLDSSNSGGKLSNNPRSPCYSVLCGSEGAFHHEVGCSNDVQPGESGSTDGAKLTVDACEARTDVATSSLKEETQNFGTIPSDSSSRDQSIPFEIHAGHAKSSSFDQSQRTLFSALSISSASGSGSHPFLSSPEENIHVKDTLSALEEVLSNADGESQASLLLALTRSETDTNIDLSQTGADSFGENENHWHETASNTGSRASSAMDQLTKLKQAKEMLKERRSYAQAPALAKSASYDVIENSPVAHPDFPRSPLLTTLLKRLGRRNAGSDFLQSTSSSDNTEPLDAEAMYSRFQHDAKRSNAVIIDVTDLKEENSEQQESSEAVNDRERVAPTSRFDFADKESVQEALAADSARAHVAGTSPFDFGDERLQMAKQSGDSPLNAIKVGDSRGDDDDSHVDCLQFARDASKSPRNANEDDAPHIKEASTGSFTYYSSDVEPLDVDELFQRYDDIVKNMVVCDEKRLARAKEKQMAQFVETETRRGRITLSRKGKKRFSLSPSSFRSRHSDGECVRITRPESPPLLHPAFSLSSQSKLTHTETEKPARIAQTESPQSLHPTWKATNNDDDVRMISHPEDSPPSLRRTHSTGSLHLRLADSGISNGTTTGSQKARDLRVQIEKALQSSAAIRDSQEKLGAELSSFKLKIQERRGLPSPVTSPRTMRSAPVSPQRTTRKSLFHQSGDDSPTSDAAVAEREPPTFKSESTKEVDDSIATNVNAVAASSPIDRIRNRHARYLSPRGEGSLSTSPSKKSSGAQQKEVPKTITTTEKRPSSEGPQQHPKDESTSVHYSQPMLVESADSDTVLDYSDDEDDGNASTQLQQIESIVSGMRRGEESSPSTTPAGRAAAASPRKRFLAEF